ncbi:hypothetical protein L1987_57080 [Smallanthus sonchifolius]|uniref:Uncharacterized protein n=1 Tax=Smallanthus sonchifolius TaxID=185202 RepID=A0ACB9DBJ5_9ASTR|nr:hypothetical protein L1987_57080 [Smallanthus sonchifolius]
MAMTIQTRWIRQGALIRRLTGRRARRVADVRTVIFGRRRILAPVPFTVVPPAAEDEHGLPAQEVILAFPAPDASSTTGAVMRGGRSSYFYRRGNRWLEESDDEEQVGDNFDLFSDSINGGYHKRTRAF